MKQKINRLIEHRPYLFGALSLAALTLLIYGDVLFGSSNTVLSRQGTDLSIGIYTIPFYVTNLRQGHFPLWNPHLLGGYPWFASFQTLLLYPPAWLFLLFSLGKAVNVFFALHVFLIGFGMFCWLKGQKLHPFSCLLAGTLLMFSSTVTMQIYAGHVTPIASMAWTTFILWAVDGCFDVRYRWRWILAGAAFASLQIMGGFPQHVYYTVLVAGIYLIGKLFLMTPTGWLERLKVLLSVAAIYICAATLCAVQLFTSFSAATETARQGKLPFSFAGSYSFPFENILTLFAPKILGDQTHIAYWGRWDMWEMICYIGITALVFAWIGLQSCSKKQRLVYLCVLLIASLISLGKYTPFYLLLYTYLPGFGSFRVNSRILFEVAVFLIALSAFGYDSLLKRQTVSVQKSIYSIGTFCLAGIFTILAAAAFWQSLPGKGNSLKVLLSFIPRAHQQYLDPHFYTVLSNMRSIAHFVSMQLLITAITLAVIGILLIALKESKRAIYYIGALAIFEVLFFTVTMRPTFDVSTINKPALTSFLSEHPGDDRFLKIPLDNWANSLPLSISGGDISGYESFRMRRYDHFVQYAQGMDVKKIFPILPFDKVSPLFGLLRCKFLFKNGHISVVNSTPLPHALLVPKWQVVTDSGKVLSLLGSKHFNPRAIAYLESPPQFVQTAPSSLQTSLQKNSVDVKSVSSDAMDIQANANTNCILLITDTYAKGWKVFPYAKSAQQKYQVLPADYALRGIPLSPGKHHFRLQYAPDAFYQGRTISLIALILFIAASFFCTLKKD